MPPKRKADGDDKKAPETKKSKAKEPVKPLDPTQPVNKQLPEELGAYEKGEGVTRMTCWNIAGYNASVKKVGKNICYVCRLLRDAQGMHRYINAEPADLLVLTETKIDKEPNDEILKSNYKHSVWAGSTKKGYAGIAVLWNGEEARNVETILPTHPNQDSTRGRIITLEFEDKFVIGTYVPNAGQGLKAMDDKVAWNSAFKTYLHDLNEKKSVVWLGDLNVCHDSKDIRNDKSNWNKSAGWTETEVNGYKEQLSDKFVDAWKELHPDNVGQYTYFGYRFDARSKGIGWRIDSCVVSRGLMGRVEDVVIRMEVYGASDHVPVCIDFKAVDEQASK
ncbi:hypothetical protein E3P81_02847 [Wallemia ichthyophaga]|uniref:Endonuclease/exonuclease/phosphatase domain-containing protein n=1 Tax=Wallemia ichthyophaga TaxID=245174 RepID=A0A4T0JY36_WALIC|nr:hypothetical protein E3P85_03080 [Wallemia ichthyophaga]TIB37380.1 hypothetical protein E3P86_02208 [Wallemia ichthyophaga]TIB48643.1 hypothetical protein E3P81_02847 [Wallemia ichthyophaga]